MTDVTLVTFGVPEAVAEMDLEAAVAAAQAEINAAQRDAQLPAPPSKEAAKSLGECCDAHTNPRSRTSTKWRPKSRVCGLSAGRVRRAQSLLGQGRGAQQYGAGVRQGHALQIARLKQHHAQGAAEAHKAPAAQPNGASQERYQDRDQDDDGA